MFRFPLVGHICEVHGVDNILLLFAIFDVFLREHNSNIHATTVGRHHLEVEVLKAEGCIWIVYRYDIWLGINFVALILVWLIYFPSSVHHEVSKQLVFRHLEILDENLKRLGQSAHLNFKKVESPFEYLNLVFEVAVRYGRTHEQLVDLSTADHHIALVLQGLKFFSITLVHRNDVDSVVESNVSVESVDVFKNSLWPHVDVFTHRKYTHLAEVIVLG